MDGRNIGWGVGVEETSRPEDRGEVKKKDTEQIYRFLERLVAPVMYMLVWCGWAEHQPMGIYLI
jgi:hypothetical protein